MTPSVLVIDDEERIVSFLTRALAANDFIAEGATDAGQGLALALGGSYDIVLLDLTMPGMDGFTVLARLIEQLPDQRVIVLSASCDVESTVRSLELGASDYVAKPFALAELMARMRARLRHEPGAPAVGHLKVNGLALDVQRREAHLGNGPVPLSNREFLLLQHLMLNEGDVCSREQLLAAVWGCMFDPGTNVVDVCVARVRSKLDPAVIQTVRNVGYCI